MDLKSKLVPLALLAITALALSRGMLALFNDPEGPNLLVVGVAAAGIYLASLAALAFNRSANGVNKFLVALIAQVLAVAGLYLLG